MSQPLIGEIRLFSGKLIPYGWALCDGQHLPIESFSDLFAVIGTLYGGNGTATFALPDLRGRVVMHAGFGPGLAPRRVAEKGDGVSALRGEKGDAQTLAFLCMQYIICLE